MTHKTTWKAFERKVARKLGTERTPLSGEASRHTSSDTLHQRLYIEVKLRKKISDFLAKLMRETLKEVKEKSKKENKNWAVVFKEKYKHDNYILLDFDFFSKIINDRRKKN